MQLYRVKSSFGTRFERDSTQNEIGLKTRFDSKREWTQNEIGFKPRLASKRDLASKRTTSRLESDAHDVLVILVVAKSSKNMKS